MHFLHEWVNGNTCMGIRRPADQEGVEATDRCPGIGARAARNNAGGISVTVQHSAAQDARGDIDATKSVGSQRPEVGAESR